MSTWETLNRLRDFHAGAAVLGAARLRPFELDLVGVIEEEVQRARAGQAGHGG